MRCGGWPGIARAAAANIASYRTSFRRSNRFISNTQRLASTEAKQRRRTSPRPVTDAIGASASSISIQRSVALANGEIRMGEVDIVRNFPRAWSEVPAVSAAQNDLYVQQRPPALPQRCGSVRALAAG
jgi:hypothetical protein